MYMYDYIDQEPPTVGASGAFCPSLIMHESCLVSSNSVIAMPATAGLHSSNSFSCAPSYVARSNI